MSQNIPPGPPPLGPVPETPVEPDTSHLAEGEEEEVVEHESRLPDPEEERPHA